MTTDNRPTTFFSVDIESSALTPRYGCLLTVGIQPVLWSVGEVGKILENSFYMRIDQTDRLKELSAEGLWGDKKNKLSSYGWWVDQNERAQDEAFHSGLLVRYDAVDVAKEIESYVKGLEPIYEQRIFVANPASFDRMWLTNLFDSTGVTDPFHYQTLCLRSMKFGLRPESAWRSSGDNHKPLIEHHAFYDAAAQAEDLVSMLEERDKKD